MSPRVSAGPPVARVAPPSSIQPRCPRASLELVLAKPFPRPPDSDTIPIASRPPVQFNPFVRPLGKEVGKCWFDQFWFEQLS